MYEHNQKLRMYDLNENKLFSDFLKANSFFLKNVT